VIIYFGGAPPGTMLEAGAVAIATMDFDGDGVLDLATIDKTGGAIVVHRSRGDRTFDTPAIDAA
jgi:hypothetical protein